MTAAYRTCLGIAMLATLSACGGETQVSEQRCVDHCARRILNSYDEGAPLSADVVHEWIAYCERSRGPCCEDTGAVYRCDVRRAVIP